MVPYTRISVPYISIFYVDTLGKIMHSHNVLVTNNIVLDHLNILKHFLKIQMVPRKFQKV